MGRYTKDVEQLRECFLSGKTRPLDYRRQQLMGILRFLKEQRDAVVDALKKDLNKPAQETIQSETSFAEADCIVILNNLEKWLKPEKVAKDLYFLMDNCFIQREPLGVCLILGAWNYPLQLTIQPLVGAIACGNCAILKPSELSPCTADLLLRELPKYLDRDSFRVVTGGPDVAQDLLTERYDHICYTGASSIAKIVMAAAAKHLTPVLLELGGKNPMYVDSTADPELSARRICWGKFMNAGQTCLAPDYIMCHPSVQSEFVRHCQLVVKEFYGDNPKDSVDYARIVNDRHFQRVLALIAPNKVVFGGTHDAKSRYIEPTIMTNVTPDDKIMQDEVFGPVMPILPCSSVEEFIKFVNVREKPLSLCVFTRSSKVHKQIRTSTSSGSFIVNDCITSAVCLTLPFGGVGHSGMGSYHGRFSIDAFSHRKACLVKDTMGERLNALRYPPYRPWKLRWINRLLAKKVKSDSSWFWPLFVVMAAFAYLFKLLIYPRLQ